MDFYFFSTEKADFRMRVFNPDGSEAEACGNGLRCFVRYISDHKMISGNTVSIETMAAYARPNF
jgi:diaminopimelate epimerase